MPAQPTLTSGASQPAGHPALKRALVVLAMIWMLALVRIVWSESASHPHVATQPQRAVATTAATIVAPVNALSTTTAAPSADDLAAVSTVKAFIPAWLTPGAPDVRQAAMAPMTTSDLIAQLANVPADALPQARLAADPSVADVDDLTAITTANLTDGTTFAVRLERSDPTQPWMVAAVDKPAGPVDANADVITTSTLAR